MWAKFLNWFKREPDLYIGGKENPYLLRWHLIPRNSIFGVYLHKIVRDDEDRALHDHPWWFISILFKGRYDEVVNDDGTKAIYRDAPSVAFRSATHRHRIVLPNVTDYSEELGFHRQSIPAWTIVITGRKVREWGFWCPKGFVPWREFVDDADRGRIGKWCGD